MLILIIGFLFLNILVAELFVIIMDDISELIVYNYNSLKHEIDNDIYNVCIKIYSKELKIRKFIGTHIPIVNIILCITIYLYTLLLKSKIKNK